MHFAQKIYYNNKPLILTNDTAEYIRQQPVGKGYLTFTGAFSRNFRLAFQHLDKAASLGAIIEDISHSALQNELHRLYEPIAAGGGVVVNEQGDVLMIFRRGKWDLPKGKLDKGESIEECSVREVSEETGLENLTLGEKICDTFHIYSQKKEQLLKCTSWYKMKGKLTDELKPQKEENILEAKWIPVKELDTVVYKSYQAIREVLTEAGFSW